MNVLRDNSASELSSWSPAAGSRLAAAWFVKQRFPILSKALRTSAVIPLELSFVPLDGVVGWGGRLQADVARHYASLRRLRYWSLEDGFLRSVGLGKARHQAISIVVDDLGIHHNPSIPSRLEKLIHQGTTPSCQAFSRQVRERLVEERLTKYNSESDDDRALPKARKAKRILIVDQVDDDASIVAYGRAAFRRMWLDALDQDAEILLRDHPDVLAGYSCGMLRTIVQPYAKDILNGCGPIDRLLAEVDEVWTVSSQFGFEALLRAKRVVTYGMPFYAGWGLTEDRSSDPASASARNRRMSRAVTIDDLVDAALVRYPVYFDPVLDRHIGVDRAMDRLTSWRREAGRLKSRYLCVGLSRHKHDTARLFLDMPRSRVSFANAQSAAKREKLKNRQSDVRVFWGRTDRFESSKSDVTIEDGFIRSVGLGSMLVRAKSLCIDPVGIYYDATRPSLLENILNQTEFDDRLLRRSRRLRKVIVHFNISKYNLSDDRFDATSLKAGRPIALVAEQLPDDASLRFGRPLHDSSLALLAAVRNARPNHFILFKRHPDILAGTRRGARSALDYCKHADYVIDRKVDIAWRGIDECHSATSQLGFEALLRGVKTYCHGAPFYSGWGLTTDSVTIDRRTRTLSIDQLVAGALILYPSYRCWRSHLPCEPEDAIREIIRERDGHA